MAVGRYTDFASVQTDRTRFVPDWEAIDSLLGQQQELYDVGMSMADLQINGHTKDNQRIQEIMSNRQDATDYVAEQFAKGISEGNLALKRFSKMVQKDYIDPNSEVYAIQSNLAKYQQARKEIEESDHPEQDKVTQLMMLESKFNGTNTGEVDELGNPKFNSYGSAYVPEYVNVQEKALEFAKSHPIHKKAWADAYWVDEAGNRVPAGQGKYIAKSSGSREFVSADELMAEVAPLLQADPKVMDWLGHQRDMDLFRMGFNEDNFDDQLQEQRAEAQGHIDQLNSLDKEELQEYINELAGKEVLKVDGVVGNKTKKARDILLAEYERDAEYNPTWNEYRAQYKNQLLMGAASSAANFYEVDNITSMNYDIKADAYRLKDYENASNVNFIPHEGGTVKHKLWDGKKDFTAVLAEVDNMKGQMGLHHQNMVDKYGLAGVVDAGDVAAIISMTDEDIANAGINDIQGFKADRTRLRFQQMQIQNMKTFTDDAYNHAFDHTPGVNRADYEAKKKELRTFIPGDFENVTGVAEDVLIDAMMRGNYQWTKDGGNYWTTNRDDATGFIITNQDGTTLATITNPEMVKRLTREGITSTAVEGQKDFAAINRAADQYLADKERDVELFHMTTSEFIPIMDAQGNIDHTASKNLTKPFTEFINDGGYVNYKWTDQDGNQVSWTDDKWLEKLPTRSSTDPTVDLTGKSIVFSGFSKEIHPEYGTYVMHMRVFTNEGRKGNKPKAYDLYTPIPTEIQRQIIYGGEMKQEVIAGGMVDTDAMKFNATSEANHHTRSLITSAKANPGNTTPVKIWTQFDGEVTLGNILRREDGSFAYERTVGGKSLITDITGSGIGGSLHNDLYNYRIADKTYYTNGRDAKARDKALQIVKQEYASN